MHQTLASGGAKQQQSRHAKAFHDVSSLKEMEPVTGIDDDIWPRFDS